MGTRRQRLVADLAAVKGDLGRTIIDLEGDNRDLWRVFEEIKDLEQRLSAIRAQMIDISSDALTKALDQHIA